MNNIQEILNNKQLALLGLEQKSVLTFEEVVQYFGFSKSLLYKLSSGKRIPHYKLPGGNLLFFNRKEVTDWIYSNRVITVSDVVSMSNEFLYKNFKKEKSC